MTKIVVALSGASGQVYGRRLMEVLAQTPGVETHLIISPSARAIIAHELGADAPAEIEKLAAHVYENSNVGAAPASGSFLLDAMVVAPCSIKTMSAIAHSYADNLITRAADVMLKERRSLLLMVRETPLHLGHLKNMARIAEMGGIIVPPVPAFYHHPRTIGDIVDHSVGRVLDLLKIPHHLFRRWNGSIAD
ncbi:MAG: UbiX family flavin prenyltransferase [Deltaproteobacteria bacterium]|nr:UbiX family flavin prenyltransferase [Deltaproteobacteria bacterium]